MNALRKHIDQAFCGLVKGKKDYYHKYQHDQDNKYPYYKVIVQSENLKLDRSTCALQDTTLRLEIHSPKQADCTYEDALSANEEQLYMYKSAIINVLRILNTYYDYCIPEQNAEVRNYASGVTEDCHIVTRATIRIEGAKIKNYYPSSQYDQSCFEDGKQIAKWKR